MKPMRRKDREVTDFQQILDILMECDVVHLGLYDEDEPEYPYIVPMNYVGYAEGDQMYMLVHGATGGRKDELMRKNGKCSFVLDGDRVVEVLEGRHDITTRFESIMGKADIIFLEGDDAIEALSYIADNFAGYDFDWRREVVKVTSVAALKITDYSCKVNARPTGRE